MTVFGGSVLTDSIAAACFCSSFCGVFLSSVFLGIVDGLLTIFLGAEYKKLLIDLILGLSCLII